MSSTSYSTPRYGNLQSNDTQLIQRLIQSITVNIQKIAQNGIFALRLILIFAHEVTAFLNDSENDQLNQKSSLGLRF